MGRTHDVTISAFDLDRLESQLSAAEEEIEELKTQLGDAKATADLWIQKAKHADESANDLVAELIDTRRHWKEELEEQARLLGMSAERECDLRGKLERERANTIHSCHDQCQRPMCVLRRERDEALEEIESIKNLLLDPNAVRINMLHGKIAKLDWEKLEHIHGNHPAREQLTAERALADRLHGALDALDYNLAFAENTAHGSLGEKITAMRAIALPAIDAWKEARSES